MSTVIRFKRKKSGGNTGVDLLPGEPYFNLNDKHFYICEQDGSFPDKHIAEVTTVTKDVSDATVKFYVGGDTTNLYEKTINNVESATYPSPDPSAGTIHTRLLNLEHKTENLEESLTWGTF